MSLKLSFFQWDVFTSRRVGYLFGRRLRTAGGVTLEVEAAAAELVVEGRPPHLTRPSPQVDAVYEPRQRAMSKRTILLHDPNLAKVVLVRCDCVNAPTVTHVWCRKRGRCNTLPCRWGWSLLAGSTPCKASKTTRIVPL